LEEVCDELPSLGWGERTRGVPQTAESGSKQRKKRRVSEGNGERPNYSVELRREKTGRGGGGRGVIAGGKESCYP